MLKHPNLMSGRLYGLRHGFSSSAAIVSMLVVQIEMSPSAYEEFEAAAGSALRGDWIMACATQAPPGGV
jgi:hypothetical protein